MGFSSTHHGCICPADFRETLDLDCFLGLGKFLPKEVIQLVLGEFSVGVGLIDQRGFFFDLRCHVFSKLQMPRLNLKQPNFGPPAVLGEIDGRLFCETQIILDNANTAFQTFAIPRCQDRQSLLREAYLAVQWKSMAHRQNLLFLLDGKKLATVVQKSGGRA